MRNLIPLICILFPIAVILAHLRFIGNPVTVFFIPRFLKLKAHPNSEYRKAGAGWFVLTIWLWLIVFIVPGFLRLEFPENNQWLLGLIFMITIFTLMSLGIAIYYLSIGLFAKEQLVKPAFNSMYEIDLVELDLAVRRLKRYAYVNITSLAICILNIIIWSMLSEELQDYFGFMGMISLFTFIVTTGPVHDYVIKSTLALGERAAHILKSVEENPFYSKVPSIFLIDILKLYKQAKTNTPFKILANK